MSLVASAHRSLVEHARTCCSPVRMPPMGRAAAIAQAEAATEFPVRPCPRGSGPGLPDKPGHNRARVDAAFPARSRLKPVLQTLAEQVSFPAKKKTRLKPVVQTPAPDACPGWC